MNWIFIKDRLPTKEENVIVFDKQEGIHEAEYFGGNFYYPYYGQEISGSFTNVVAWCELPLPPNDNI